MQLTIRGFSISSAFLGIGGSALSILAQFLTNISQPVVVDGCRCKLVNVGSGVQHGHCFRPVIAHPVYL